MNPRTLNIIAIVIAGIVVVQEISWIGRSNIAIVILSLGGAIFLIALSVDN